MAKLLDYEWKFLLQLVSRIDAAEGYEETCRVLMEHLQTVLPFDRAFCLRIGREEGRVSISEPVNYRLSDDYSVFLNGSYPRWSEFIMSPSSMVFSQSELVEESIGNAAVFIGKFGSRGTFIGGCSPLSSIRISRLFCWGCSVSGAKRTSQSGIVLSFWLCRTHWSSAFHGC